MIRYSCPPTHRWAALLADDLPPAEQADLSGHLEFCPACQRALEDCAAHRDAWAVTAKSLGQPGPTRDQALRDVIDSLKLDPESDHDSSDGAELPLDFLDPPSEPPGSPRRSLGRIHQYEVLEEVGRGGMGVVLKALDPGLHRVVAIKVLAPQLAVSGTARKRFTREARAAAAVGHENVVTIHAVEEFKGLPYLVMQYIAGPSVQQRLAEGGALPVAEILRIGFQTAAGLAAAHAQGLIHRDVKPANILLENGVERVKLTDFSLARAIDDASVTQTGVVTGTPPYMAPEQARGEPLDHRADLFSLGSVLYALCTGRPPFRGHSLDVLRKVSEEVPVPIRTLNSEIPSWLEAIVTKLMAKNPVERYQSAGEVSALLERCLAHVQQPTTVPLPAGVIPRQSRKRRWLVAAAAASVVLLAVTVLKIKTANGTLEIALDDPQATVTVDGTDIVVSGMQGVKEFRLKAGDYTVHQTKDGKPEKTEVVSIKQGEKTPLRVTFEGDGRAVSKTPPAAGRLGTNSNEEVARAQYESARARALAARAAATQAETTAQASEKKAAAGQMRQSTAKVDRAKANEAEQVALASEEEAVMYHDLWRGLIRFTQKATSPVVGSVVTQPQRSFPTDAGEVSSAVFSADGNNLFVADWGGSIYSYNFATGKLRFTIAAGKSGGSRFLAVSPDDKYLVGVGTDSTIQFIQRGKVQRTLAGKCDPYYAVAFSSDGKTLAAGGCAPQRSGGILELWDLESGKVRTVEFPDYVGSLAFPTGVDDRLAVGTGGDNIRMLYPSTAKTEYSLKQPGMIRAMAFSPDAKLLAASSDNQMHLWDWGTSHEVTFTGHAGRVTTVQFSPDGKRLVTASLDGTAKLWDVHSGKPVATFAPGTYKTGMGVAVFTPDGKSLVTAGDDGKIRVWDLAVFSEPKAADPRTSVPILSDIPLIGDMFRNRVNQERAAAEAALAQAEANVQIARANEARGRDGVRVNQAQRNIKADAGGPVLSAVFTPDGKRLIIAGHKRSVQEYDVDAGNPVRTLMGKAGDNPLVVVSPDGTITAAGGSDRSVHLFNRLSTKWLRTLGTNPATVHALAFGPDGKTLAVGGRTDKGGGLVGLVDLESGIARPVEFPTAVLSLAFDMAGQNRLAVGLNTDNVRMVDTEKAAVIYTLPQPGPIDQVAFSKDAKWLATTEGDNQVHLWDWQVSRLARTLTGHADRVSSVRFSPDGNRLATASLDGTVRLWDVASGRVMASFSPNAGKLYVAEFAPDGKSLVTAGDDREIRFWDLTSVQTLRTEQVPGATLQRYTQSFTGKAADGYFLKTKRNLRWTVTFNTQSGADYLKQLDTLGAFLAYPKDGEIKCIKQLMKRPVEPVVEDLAKLDCIFWTDDKRDSVEQLARALRLNFVPDSFMALFPQEFENELLRKELAFRNRKESEISETRFQIRIQGRNHETVVTDQQYVGGAAPEAVPAAVSAPSHETIRSANQKEVTMKSIVYGLIGVGLSIPATAAGAGENILQNPSFEDGASSPTHWSQGAEIDGVRYLWDKEQAQQGKASVCLHKTAKRYFPIAQWYQIVPRTGDKPSLRVAAQVKAQDVTKAIIDVVFLDEKGEWISHQWVSYVGAKQPDDPAVSHDWKEYAGTVKIPKEAKKIQVGLQIYGPGKVWFDAVRAEYTD
jgi:WD40 repeat protein